MYKHHSMLKKSWRSCISYPWCVQCVRNIVQNLSDRRCWSGCRMNTSGIYRSIHRCDRPRPLLGHYLCYLVCWHCSCRFCVVRYDLIQHSSIFTANRRHRARSTITKQWEIALSRKRPTAMKTTFGILKRSKLCRWVTTWKYPETMRISEQMSTAPGEHDHKNGRAVTSSSAEAPSVTARSQSSLPDRWVSSAPLFSFPPWPELETETGPGTRWHRGGRVIANEDHEDRTVNGRQTRLAARGV